MKTFRQASEKSFMLCCSFYLTGILTFIAWAESAGNRGHIAVPKASTLKAEKPVLHYTFDTLKKDTVKDSSGRGNHATIHGATWTSQGVSGGSLTFDGATSHVDAKLKKKWANLLNGQHPVSFSLWFNRQSLQGDALFIQGSDPQACLCHFSDPDHERLYFFFKRVSDAESIRVFVDGFVETNEWLHLAITYNGSGDAGGIAIYKNGVAQAVQIAENGLAGPIQSVGPLTIGAYRGNDHLLNWFFKGGIDEFMIFDHQLTSEKVNQLLQTQTATKSLIRL